jgi:hypothetical protein
MGLLQSYRDAYAIEKSRDSSDVDRIDAMADEYKAKTDEHLKLKPTI